MELASLTLAELAADLRAKKISSLELCEAAIERHEGQDKKLNAYRDWAPERARAQARAADQAFAAGRDLGPLQGLPQSIKDIYGVPGYETFAGTPKALPEAWRRAGPLVEKLLGQSGVVMGKSHTVEFALGTLGLNDHWGTPYNPWDPDHHRAPGGSSSGAGVSLTEGSALIAWGSDTAGSIRCPASMTGCVGYKASNGRWPTGGIVPLSRSLDVPGPLVRSAADLAYVWAAVEEVDPAGLAAPSISDIRIGIADDFFWDDCSPGVSETIMTALDKLIGAGASTVAAAIPSAADASAFAQIGGLAAYEFAHFISDNLPEWENHVSPWVAQRISAGRELTDEAYAERQAMVVKWQAEAPAFFDDCDVIVSPTTPLTPPRLDEVATPETFRAGTLLKMRNTCVGNVLDFAVVTFPVGRDAAGMPVGLQLMAKAGDDRHLIDVALGFEQVLGSPRSRLGDPPL